MCHMQQLADQLLATCAATGNSNKNQVLAWCRHNVCKHQSPVCGFGQTCTLLTPHSILAHWCRHNLCAGCFSLGERSYLYSIWQVTLSSCQPLLQDSHGDVREHGLQCCQFGLHPGILADQPITSLHASNKQRSACIRQVHADTSSRQ